MSARRAALLFLFASFVCAALPAEDALLKIALDANAGTVERTRAFADLQGVATEAAIPRLAALLSDPAWSYPVRAVLEAMPSAAAEQALLAALVAASGDTLRAGLIESLGNRASAAAVPEIAKALQATAPPAITRAALNALGNIGTAAAAEALMAHVPADAMLVDWADALLRTGEKLAESNRSKAIECYRVVRTKGLPAQRTAATMNLARFAPEPAGIIAALKSADAAQRLAALTLLRNGELGVTLTEAAGRTLPSLSPEVQVQVLSVLQDRGDRAAASAARHALAAADPAVQAAAARLLSVVGEPADAPALLRIMVGPEEPAPSARLALARIPGADVTARLLETFRRGGEARAAALDVLVNRGHRELLTDLLRPEFYADDSFRPLAVNAVLALATGADLGRVLELHRQLPPAQRGALETAVRRVAAKHPSPDEAAKITIAAAQKLPLAGAALLYVTLAAIGGDAAFASLTGLLRSAQPETRQAAARALESWRDVRPAETLLALARDDPDASVRALAIRAATTLFAKSAYGGTSAVIPENVPAAIAGLRKAWAAALQPAEKNAILAALKNLKTPEALAAAAELDSRSAPSK